MSMQKIVDCFLFGLVVATFVLWFFIGIKTASYEFNSTPSYQCLSYTKGYFTNDTTGKDLKRICFDEKYAKFYYYE